MSRNIALYAEDHLRLFRNARAAGLLSRKAYERRCMAIVNRSIAGSWWKDGGSPLKAMPYLLKALFLSPGVVLRPHDGWTIRSGIAWRPQDHFQAPPARSGESHMKRGIIQAFLTQIPTLLLFFIASTVMTRLLGEEGRGTYTLLFNFGLLSAVLLSLNLHQGILYWSAKDPGRVRQVGGVGAALFLVNMVVAPVMLFLIVRSPTHSSTLLPGEDTPWTHVAFILATIMCSQVAGICSAIFLALKRFRVVNRMSVMNAGLSAVGFGTLFLLRERFPSFASVDAVLGVSIAALCLLTATWLLLYRALIGPLPRPVFDRRLLLPVLRFSLTGYAAYLITLVNLRFDTWVIEHYRTTAELGFYAVAVGLAQVLFYLPEPLARVVQPFLYAGNDPRMIAQFKMVSRLNFTAVLTCCALLAAVSGVAVPLLFGAQFVVSVTPLLILLPGVLFICTVKLLTPLIINQGGVKYHLISNMVGAIVTVVLDLLLIPAHGIAGAALASSVGAVVMLLTVGRILRTRCGMALNDLLLLRPSDLRYLRALVRGAASFGLPAMEADPSVPAPEQPAAVPASRPEAMVSVIMPARNASAHIAEAIESVLAQDHPHWELLVVDNGSTDATAAVVERYVDPRIRLFREPLPGVARARNIALRHAQGSFLCFLDADDRLPVNAISVRLRPLLEQPELHFVDGAMQAFDNATGAVVWERTTWHAGPPFDALMQLDGSCFLGNTWMVRRVPGHTYSFPEHMHHSEDVAFYLGIAHQGSYARVRDVVLHYRTGHGSATSDIASMHQGYLQLHAYMTTLPTATRSQLARAWRRLRKVMFIDLVKQGRFMKALQTAASPPPKRR
ncbi:MAG TPA: glycosyltransferase, partial [Flavobacteriales bacterium]